MPALKVAPAPAFISASEPQASAGPWVYLSKEEATRHRLWGVHGWLTLVAVFLVLGILRGTLELVEFWSTVDHGGQAAWVMAAARSVTAFWAVLILALLFARSRAFPANFAAFTVVNIVYQVLFGLAYAHLTQGSVLEFVAADIALNLIAWAYVARSRRVNVTYLRRVRAK